MVLNRDGRMTGLGFREGFQTAPQFQNFPNTQ